MPTFLLSLQEWPSIVLRTLSSITVDRSALSIVGRLCASTDFGFPVSKVLRNLIVKVLYQ